MSDLIRRADATDILADLYLADERLLNFKTEIDAVYDKILALPPASVEVVRCKDCRWHDNRYGDVCHNPRYGDGWANYPPPYVDEDYWCKDGERKGGDSE